MSDSGPPKHWPFEVIDPSDFKRPSRTVDVVRVYDVNREEIKEELVEALNEQFILDGWYGIGYHFVIDKLGNICKARPLDEVAQTGEDGRAMIAIGCVHSDKGYESRDKLCQAIQEASELARKQILIRYTEN